MAAIVPVTGKAITGSPEAEAAVTLTNMVVSYSGNVTHKVVAVAY